MSQSNTNPITQTELEKAIEEAQKALRCLFISVEEHVAIDVNAKLDPILTAAKQLSALEAKCAEMREALKKCERTFQTLNEKGGYNSTDNDEPSKLPPNIVIQSVIAITQALSSTCGQNYIHKDKVREMVKYIKPMECLCFGKHPNQIKEGYICDRCEALQLAKAEGLIE